MYACQKKGGSSIFDSMTSHHSNNSKEREEQNRRRDKHAPPKDVAKRIDNRCSLQRPHVDYVEINQNKQGGLNSQAKIAHSSGKAEVAAKSSNSWLSSTRKERRRVEIPTQSLACTV